ncbi:hypothetical protein D3C81_1723600 [compost metagenome]
MALQSILTKIADTGKDYQGESLGELLEAVLSLVTEQGEDINNLLTKASNGFTRTFGRIFSKNIGAVAMAEDLLKGSDKHDDIIECLLTLMKSQFNDIQTVRLNYTE